ncbi:MAG: hypothetical protein ACRCZF_05235 [Gemmataceae bacterium]
MMPTLLLLGALTLTPAQSGGLQLTNVRNTYGELGGTRPDSKLIPGDILFVGFDIEGITINGEGQVQYTMAMEVVDKNNKPIFKQDPAKKTDFVPLGGTKLPARAFVTIGVDQEPGEYTLKLTVTDNGNPASPSANFSRKFEIGKKDFGIVIVYTSIDAQGAIPAPTTGVVGQAVFVQFFVVGFDRAKDPKDAKKAAQPNVSIEMNTVDEKGQATLKKPVTFVMNNGIDEKEGGFTMRFLLPMTRVGKFTVKLKVTDEISKKTATFDLPVAVVPAVN